ncbi:LytR C-terminal domain-containing protein [Antrihabitans cavernicola]|uniref:LytR family transcriptional regulator n=1 Tax=Antrihabitans cavernicola TaxID=2495913 RepID=A0A5A7S7J8_9NOCA|nr:LytR C-terminal domain-containing protein [Spelaeibacter cavernicola]KAA0022138.1 LytR family transcriptional regulator [Spelaeibacter cavernicola]
MSNPNPPSGGPPLRALAMVLIALAIVFGGLGALSLSKSDSGGSSSSGVSPSVAPLSGSANTPGGSAVPPTSAAGGSTGSDSEASSTTTSAGASSAASGSGSAGASGTVDKTVAVRVFNNSSITGLAAKTADELKADGWNVAETGNYSEGQIPKTTVYYGDSASEKTAAEAIANTIGASAEKRFAGIENSSPGVIVIVTQ